MPQVALPVIAESAEKLLELRRAQRDERLRERLHALWLVASGAQSSRTALARALGRNRETISRWLSDYAHGGLAALLRARKPTGPPSQGGIALPAEVRA
jgi:transposase-like protein